MSSRDPRFDGRFVVAVTSTGVYCRPSCPSRTPRPENTRFFRLPAGAETAGFRACRRCRPDVAPSSPEWNVRGDLTARALRLISGGTVDQEGVTGLARRLAVSERHLHRQLVAEVGVGPQALAISRRAQLARMLVESSALPLAEVAFAAGYSSVRQFNDGVRAAFGCPPGELRRRRPAEASGDGRLTLRLAYRPPLAVEPLLAWLAAHALPGVEAVTDGQYHRTLRLPHGPGRVAVSFDRVRRSVSPGFATVGLALTDVRDVAAAVQRCRDIFDLDADPALIEEDLLPDPVLGPLMRARPGLRVPGCADGFELAVTAVLGRRAGRLADITPEALLDADVPVTVRALAQAVVDKGLTLDRGADRDEAVAVLRAIPGIGPQTAGYIAMRALADPDVFPLRDAKLRATARRHWRPWRSYAAMHLWSS
ncbi:AlkA N-terminal domain-containing protein [Phytohabitans rumicis]